MKTRKPPRMDKHRASDEWYTPPGLLQRCLQYTGVTEYTLDVAACDEAHVCKNYFTKKENGLTQAWSGHVWCNPPYSNIAPWVEYAWYQWKESLDVKSISMLLPANRTDQNWWEFYVEGYRDRRSLGILTTRFLRGRAAFAYPGSKGKVKKGGSFGLVLLMWK